METEQRKYKILVADDSEMNQILVANAFSKMKDNIELIYANDGTIACSKAMAEKPDLIFMDMVMPEMNGFEAIQFLKLEESTKEIPIVAMTISELLEQSLHAGANDFITKPFDPTTLVLRARLSIELVESLNKIKVQNLQLKKQTEELILHRDQIEEQKKDIEDDMRYSRRIQLATLPTNQTLHELFPQHFIFYKPKRIVSGDFYWAIKKDGKTVLLVADCTGHGISGAFMTIAGIAFLNEIFNTIESFNAAEILNQLRTHVMKLLKQKGESGEAADGMDIALCIIDHVNGNIQYSGANNPIYMVRKDGSFEKYNADKMPIGIHVNYNRPFSNIEIKYYHDDMLYLFSDGYADQFGGANEQKFRYNRLQNMFVEIHSDNVNEQMQMVEKTMADWMGCFEQIDDMLIIGVKL